MKRSGAVWLIGIGGIFLAYQLGYIHDIGDLIRTFWPTILIVTGLSQLLSAKKHSSSIVGHLILIAIGGYFQARNLDLTDLGTGEFFKFLIPAGLITIGIYTLIKPKRVPEYPSPRPERPDDFSHTGSTPNHQPPIPPAPIEPLESPLDRMFVNLDKDEPKNEPKHERKSESKRYEWKPEVHRGFDREEPENRSGNGSEFHKIGDMAREIGKQTADQVRKIDFSRIADEVKSEVDSAMKDFKKSMNHETDKQKHGTVSLEKDPFAEEFSDDGRFYEECDENSRHAYSGYDREQMRKARQTADKEKKDKTVNESSFIGDYYIGRDYFRLKPLNVSHFIGDTVIDLTKAQIPYGTTRINISSFIGDVVIYMPNDPEVGVKVHTSSFLGNHNVLNNRRSGMVGGVDETRNYDDCAKRIKINVSSFISDVNVNIVG